MLNTLPALDRLAAQTIAERVINSTSDDHPFSAAEILLAHPGLNQFATIVVDLAYEEFCRRLEAGECVDPKLFADGFEEVTGPLYRQLLFHLAINDDRVEPISSTSDWPSVSTRLLHFDLIQQLGEGGRSRVYLVADHRMEGRNRVLKLTRSSRKEAVSLSKLSHPSIIDGLYQEHDPVSGFSAICFPVLGRFTLQHVIKFIADSAVPLRTVGELFQELAQRDDMPSNARHDQGYDLRQSDVRPLQEIFRVWARQILEGLGHAHAQGYLHCDIKPSNILIAWSGDAILLDFDASLPLNESCLSTGGTLAYMAPEQLELLKPGIDRAGARLDAATDLYGWGITFYELLNRDLPFQVLPADKWSVVVESHLASRPQAIRWKLGGKNGDPALRQCLQKCLIYERERRPRSARELIEILSEADKKRPRSALLQRMVALIPAALLATVFFRSDLIATPESHFRNGVAALHAGDFNGASRNLILAVERRPSMDSARTALVTALLHQANYADAIRHLELLPKSAWSRRCRAYALISGNYDTKDALTDLAQIIDSDEADASDYNNAAFVLLRSISENDIQKARSWLNDAIALDPKCEQAAAQLLIADRRLFVRTGEDSEKILCLIGEQWRDSVMVQTEVVKGWAIRGRAITAVRDAENTVRIERITISALMRAMELGMAVIAAQEVIAIWPRLQGQFALAEIQNISERRIAVDAPRLLINPALLIR